jgi:5-methylthioadenosine/S-adenosylhomocysteine deaminase
MSVEAAASAPDVCDILVRRGRVITMDAQRTVYGDGAVAVRGSEIAMVGPTEEVERAFRARRTVDAGGAPVHPGFIDPHFHIPNQLTRGVLPESRSSAEYFSYYSRWYDVMDAAYERAAAAAAALEMLHAGVTCFMEPGTCFETDAVADGLAEVGVRASLSEPFLWDTGQNDFLSYMHRVPPDTKRCERLLGSELRRNADPDALVRGHVALFGSGTATDGLTRAAVELAAQHGVAFTQHQNTRVSEVSAQREMYGGQAPLIHLAEIGALAPHCAFTHMNLLEPEEIRAVEQSGLSINWCAAGSMNWGFGAAGARRHHAALFLSGVNVAIASDVPRWGQDTSPLITFLLSRDEGAGPLEAEHIFEMATLSGARAVGLEHAIGSIEPGKKADIVVRRSDAIEFQPGFYPLQNLVMTSRSRTVGTVIVNGVVVIEKGRATLVDEAEVSMAARNETQRLADEIGLRPFEAWPVR